MLNPYLKSDKVEDKFDIRLRAYHFSSQIIKFCEKFPNKRVYWTIADQLLRSCTSIGANLIEAMASSSKRDFIKFYDIALKSANETEYWLWLLHDSRLNEIDVEEVEKYIAEVHEISCMIGKGLITLKGKSRS